MNTNHFFPFIFQYRKLNGGASSDGDFINVCFGSSRIHASSASAKECVESLHQNNKAALLYGKNNVLVLPVITIDKNTQYHHYSLISYELILLAGLFGGHPRLFITSPNAKYTNTQMVIFKVILAKSKIGFNYYNF